MSSIADYVVLTITQNSVGITRAGFGVPLLLSATAAFAERIRFYTDLAAVAVDFSVTTSAEYLAAQAIFSQSPAPTRIAIGRSANKPTLVYTLNVVTVRNLYTYTLLVKGKGVTPTTVTFTSDGTATDGEIVVGLVAALQAVVGRNYAAAGATSPFTMTGTAAGDWFSIESPNPDDIKVSATHADPGVAADLTAINLENNGFYAIYTFYNSNAYALAVCAWAESNKKLYIMDTNETDSIRTAIGNSETLDDIRINAYTRTAGFYHPNPAAMAGAAWLGARLPYEPGSETWAFARLNGVAAVNLTATHRLNLTNRRASSIENVAGINITFGGQTGDGNYIDVRRGLDWLEDDMAKGVFGVLAANPKIPYTDKGAAVLEGEVRASLKRATDRGILTDNPAFTITVPKVADQSTADKTARLFSNIKFSATLAGAVHKVTVNGTVSV